MNWMQLVASLVASLAWPAVTVIAFVLFRKAIVEHILPTLTKFRAGVVEAEFKREIGSATLTADQPIVDADSQAEEFAKVTEPPRKTSSLDVLSVEVPEDWRALRANPNGVVMEAWSGLEKLLRAKYASIRESADSDIVFASVIGDLISRKAITKGESSDILKLQAARDIAAHNAEAISQESANEFARLIARMQQRLQRRWSVE